MSASTSKPWDEHRERLLKAIEARRRCERKRRKAYAFVRDVSSKSRPPKQVNLAL